MNFKEFLKTSEPLAEAYDPNKDNIEQQIKDIRESFKAIENDAYRKDNYTFAYDIAFNALLLYSNMIKNSNDAKAKAHKKVYSNVLKDVIKQL